MIFTILVIVGAGILTWMLFNGIHILITGHCDPYLNVDRYEREV